MAKAKDESTVETPAVPEDLAGVVAALKTQIDDLTKSVRAALERLEAVENQATELAMGLASAKAEQPVSQVLQTAAPSKSEAMMGTAAVIAGQIAAGSSTNGLLTGAQEDTIALSAIRVAVSLYRVGEVVVDNPSLLDCRIAPAFEALEKIMKQKKETRSEAAATE